MQLPNFDFSDTSKNDFISTNMDFATEEISIALPTWMIEQISNFGSSYSFDAVCSDLICVGLQHLDETSTVPPQ